jgi:hypothetical protein
VVKSLKKDYREPEAIRPVCSTYTIILLISAPGILRQDDLKLEVSMGCIASPVSRKREITRKFLWKICKIFFSSTLKKFVKGLL